MRTLGVATAVLTCGVAFISLGACGGDEFVSSPPSDAGADSALQGGSAGQAGSGGTAQFGGTAGSAGASAQAGAGGTAGSGGVAGSAGSAGIAASAGAGGGTGGVSGTAGSAGTGGVSGTAGSAGAAGTAGASGAGGSSSWCFTQNAWFCDDFDAPSSALWDATKLVSGTVTTTQYSAALSQPNVLVSTANSALPLNWTSAYRVKNLGLGVVSATLDLHFLAVQKIEAGTQVLAAFQRGEGTSLAPGLATAVALNSGAPFLIVEPVGAQGMKFEQPTEGNVLWKSWNHLVLAVLFSSSAQNTISVTLNGASKSFFVATSQSNSDDKTFAHVGLRQTASFQNVVYYDNVLIDRMPIK